MRTLRLAIALLVSACARPMASFEEPPLVRSGTNDAIHVTVIEDFGVGTKKVDTLIQGHSIFLIGELSPRLNPLRGSGTLLVIATADQAEWFFRPLVGTTNWSLYYATVEFQELHLRAFTRWVLIGENSIELRPTMIATQDPGGTLPAIVEVKAGDHTEAKGDTYAYLFPLE